jgi:hypothetical protein
VQRCRGAEVQVKCRGAVKQRFRGAEVPKLSRGDCADDCAGAEAVQRSRGGAEQMWRRCRGAEVQRCWWCRVAGAGCRDADIEVLRC